MSSCLGLSVVVPNYRSPFLREVLGEVMRLEPHEIIVVDSSPEPTTLDESIQVVRCEDRVWAGRARNLGAKKARGSHILFLDSDCLLTDATRSYIANYMLAPEHTVVSGTYVPVLGRGGVFSRFLTHICRYRITRGQQQHEHRVPVLCSSVLIAKREGYHLVGGFNEELETYEDFEFSARCTHLGHRPAYAGELAVEHLKQLSAAGIVWDYSRKAFNAFQARRRYPQVFGKVSSFLGAPTVLTWGLGAALLPLAAASSLRPDVLPWSVLIGVLFVLLLLSPPLIVRLTPGESAPARLADLSVWPWIGAGVVAALLVSAAAWYLERVCSAVRSASDYARAGWRIVFRTGLPVQIISYVTSRCNLRCEHCFYKGSLDDPDHGELPLEVFERATKSVGPVLWFSLAGGEPFVRRDLVRLISLIQAKSRPKVFSLPTNGWYTEQTFETILRVLHKQHDGSLILSFSVDGDKDTHDLMRGEGSYERARLTMRRMRALTELYPRLYLNVILTVTPTNADSASAVVEEIVRDFRPSAVSINLFRYHSLEHPPLPRRVIDGYEAAVEAYATLLVEGRVKHYGFFGGRILWFKDILQKELILRVARNNEFVTPCTAGTLSYVIMEDGRVLPCEVLADTIGNVIDSRVTLGQMTRLSAAKSLRKRIVKTKCRCTYECAMSTNTLFSWPMTRRLTKAMVKDLLRPS